MEFLKNLEWRYATKQFDPTKQLTIVQLEHILQAVNLAPSSYGLQPFRVIVVDNKELRNKLKQAAWGQAQVTDASHLIVFAAHRNLTNYDVDKFLDRIAQVTGVSQQSLTEYGNGIKGKVNNFSKEERFIWASKQCYIALGFLLAACANMHIDACPMEGFEAAKFDDILNLKEKELSSVVMATVGYRAVEDKYRHQPKVRKNPEELVIRL
ncbi:NAD(P)H-dependent oxidoreductase [Saccharicrinis fermentans]|uniref:Putative NAD(P)H nitroreductase YfkO n=1 Tax=Saccharicrinis fermentans DSM 9555 = JCM 21142 TaxID=869213 RepID=W7Y8X5_9BACT|nr:NAD(P)H-dependent oxidoreductase [Saccharicrinis fermentans]GAF04717.1 putative NAD(P)H nitroreductase YfkO [Saccharicrinis fermentans DSM 9555 = JCM 21142]